MAREFIVPGEIISGSGALDMAEGALKLLGKKALIVTCLLYTSDAADD